MIEKSRNNVLPRRADIQGAQHGLRIGLIGFFLADVVFAAMISSGSGGKTFFENLLLFMHEDQAHVYLIALLIMLLAGSISGKVLERRSLSDRTPLIWMSLIVSLTTLVIASVLTGVTVFLIEWLDSTYFSSDDLAVLFGPMALVLIFGLVPAGLTGLLYGVYIRRMYRMIGH